VTSARAAFLQAMATGTMAQAVLRGQVRIAGNRRALQGLGEVFDTPDAHFPIVTP
jgi:alkyl sulfatase BDS1-like metallo-beta-lactamase superfamily hydrolase